MSEVAVYFCTQVFFGVFFSAHCMLHLLVKMFVIFTIDALLVEYVCPSALTLHLLLFILTDQKNLI
jgi:hypothetical protein